MLKVNDFVHVAAGCRDRRVAKHEVLLVTAVDELGPDYSHQVRVVLQHTSGRKIAWYARHKNRLADAAINLNDGNPLHRITVQV